MSDLPSLARAFAADSTLRTTREQRQLFVECADALDAKDAEIARLKGDLAGRESALHNAIQRMESRERSENESVRLRGLAEARSLDWMQQKDAAVEVLVRQDIEIDRQRNEIGALRHAARAAARSIAGEGEK